MYIFNQHFNITVILSKTAGWKIGKQDITSEVLLGFLCICSILKYLFFQNKGFQDVYESLTPK